jgi:putative transposase
MLHQSQQRLRNRLHLEMVRMIEFLKAENRILRSKLSKRVDVAPAERAKLVKLGKWIGPGLRDLITIVCHQSFCRWLSDESSRKNPAEAGRPRKPEELRALVVQVAKDTGWGFRRILGELKKLRIRSLSLSRNWPILMENGVDPAPELGPGSRHEFVRRHLNTLWACDFFTKKVWIIRGPVEYYVLFFIHIATRRVHISGMTPNPNAIWMTQQARNMSMYFDEQGKYKPTQIIWDRDTKFTANFCSILEADGIEFRPIPARSPNMNPHAERWVQSAKRECLDHFMVFEEEHLRYIIQEYLAYYHRRRPHQGLGNLPLGMTASEMESGEPASLDDLACREWLGGVLKHWERKAA